MRCRPLHTLLAFVALLAPVIIVSGTARAATPPAAACPAGRCLDVAIPLPSGVHVPSNKVRILLPADYYSSSRHYPVIYLLSGYGGTYQEWTLNTDLGTWSAQYPAIFVMPDGGTNATAGWYSDWFDGTYQFESWHINVVLPWVNQHLRTLPGHNAVAGLSMGGLGALTYAERHPSLFRATASFSGLADNQYGAPVSGLVLNASRIWGDQIANADVWAAHNPTAMAAKLKGKTVLIACGTGQPDASGIEENVIFQTHIPLLLALQRAGVAHTDRFYPLGQHTWTNWQADLHWAMPMLMKAIT